jgi:ATP-binding cassette subfamily F protein 3
MADGDHEPATLDAYARAQARLEHAGGYTWRERAMAVVRGLGFDEPDLDRLLSTFSGGELTRASLARTLAGDPDLLLLDEPTNHLDIASLEWLEAHLVSLDTAIVLVAHDRWFLESVGTSVLELEAGRGKFFSGTWHEWRREQAARELALGRAIERQQAEIERLERFVTRFRAGTRARQAQSRVKKLNKMERISADPKDGAALRFAFKPPERSGRVIFELEHADLSAGGKHLLRDAELWLERGEHVSLVGANGAGKTTLIETLAGRRELRAGKLRTGHNVKIGFLSQHAEELNAGSARTVVEAAQHATGLTPGKARALLGRFLFSGEDAEKPLDGLSGGERRRLSLAILVQSGSNVLILDEPTNHLDLESREALESALRDFPGSLLLVSHDRALLDAIGTRTIALEDSELHSYVGGWPEYLRVRAERAKAPAPAKPAKPSKPSKPAKASKASTPAEAPAGSGDAAPRKRTPPKGKSGGRGQRSLEAEIEAAEAALRVVEDELADPSAWSTPEATARSTARHDEAKRAVAELYERWEAVAG